MSSTSSETAPPRGAAAALGTPATLGAPAAPLPVQLTGFVGREHEVTAVRRLLGATRLLTLTGAGGSGKTRLALEVCAQVAHDYAHGVAWVELAPLGDPDQLADHVAVTLGVRAEGSLAVEEALVAALRGRAMLLALDNCEHLVDACARLAETLLRQCPQLRILATSREALGVGGERSWLVPVLSLPDDPRAATAEAAGRSEAVQLFVQRAQDVLPSFVLDDANAGAVARICRRVDGLPLAIELAAARTRVLAPEQIAARLDDSFRVLAAGMRTALPRHRTLHEAIGWSYRLLDERERLLLERLSVFAGDWSIEAAEAACADEAVQRWEVLDLLGALVDKSLVVMREAAGTARYHLLETIRQYAAERLQTAGRAEHFHARHAAVYAALVAEAEPHFVTAQRREAVERVGREIDNLRVSLGWSREHDPALHLRLAGMLPWLWYSLGLWSEGRRWLEGALALPAAAAPTPPRAAALFGAGVFASLQADTVPARAWLTESRAIARAEGDARLAAYAGTYLGMAFAGQGLDDDGEAPTQEALAWFREAGDLYGHRLALLLLATMHLSRGDVARAADAAEQAVAVARAFGLDRELGIALQVFGTIVLHLGDTDRAEALMHEAMQALRRDPQPLFMARALDVLGLIACRRGDPLLGARRFGAAAAARELIGAALFSRDRERLAPHVAAARTAAGDAAFTAAWDAGAAQPLDVAVAEVLDAATAAAAPAPAPASSPAAPAGTPAVAGAAVVAESEPAARLRVLALGPVEVWRDGVLVPGDAWRSAKMKELLLHLLTCPEGRTREQIGLVFWPDASAAQVKNNFHVTLHHLRKALGGAEWIVFEDDRYRVNWSLGVAFDAARFEADVVAATRAVARGGAALTSGVERLRAALAPYRGDFLEQEGAGDWHLERRDHLRRLFNDGSLALGARLEEAESHVEAADVYRRLVLADPLAEEACRRLMTCLARDGRRTEAMRHYERLAALLRADLDAEPEASTTALYDRLRRATAV